MRQPEYGDLWWLAVNGGECWNACRRLQDKSHWLDHVILTNTAENSWPEDWLQLSSIFFAKSVHPLHPSQVYTNIIMAADQVSDCALCCVDLPVLPT